jgi:hypothetical protein
VAPAGRFLTNTAAEAVTSPITIVQHWTEELERIVPTN